MKQLNLIKPVANMWRLSGTSNDVLGVITTEMLSVSNLTSSELGIENQLIFFDKSSSKRNIVTTFDLETVRELKSNGFGNIEDTYPKLEALQGYFYFGNIKDYIYDINEKKGEISFRWHPNLTLAYLCNISLLDRDFRIEHKVAINKEKQKDHSQVPIIFEVYGSIGCAEYNPTEVPKYFEKLLNK